MLYETGRYSSYNFVVLGSYFLKSAVEKSNRPGVFLSVAEKYRGAYVITRMSKYFFN
jgi:hypothetical protein